MAETLETARLLMVSLLPQLAMINDETCSLRRNLLKPSCSQVVGLQHRRNFKLQLTHRCIMRQEKQETVRRQDSLYKIMHSKMQELSAPLRSCIDLH